MYNFGFLIAMLLLIINPVTAQNNRKPGQTFRDCQTCPEMVVWQWVDDCYSSTYSDLPTDGSANKKDIRLDSAGKFEWMIMKNSCSFHIVRGGSALDSPLLLRSAFRNWGGIPGAINPDLSRTAGGGFRVARAL